MIRIVLLDIDGVLVQPGGYRAALRATVRRFIGNFHVEEDLLTDLEKRGISSEWDMSPLIIAAYWEDVLARHSIENLSGEVAMAAQQILSQPVNAPKQLSVPEFDLVVGQYPAETAFRAEYFSHIPEVLKRNLLVESRNVRKSETMRTFQHFTLGSKHYEETYNLKAEFETESLLLKHDHSNMASSTRARLFQNGRHIAAFTARPSHPPCEVTDTTFGYAPEAELALELVGMRDIPLIAFGKLEYIAAQHGLDPATLVKPSPFQALAGTLAAWTGEELSALQAAYDWHVSGELNSRFNGLPKLFELIVVEDTMGGVRSARAAGEILQKAGFDVTVKAYGLTSGISAKKAAFEQAGVPHFESWNELISVL
jgi:phosphoglycolate phosphatase-like HAD superfamily hydrolase